MIYWRFQRMRVATDFLYDMLLDGNFFLPRVGFLHLVWIYNSEEFRNSSETEINTTQTQLSLSGFYSHCKDFKLDF